MRNKSAVTSFRFWYDFRVRFAETDSQGVVHNSNFLIYCEVGRTEYLRATGLTYSEMLQQGIDFVLAVSHIEYRRPARFDQELRCEVAIAWIKRTSFQFCYRMTDQRTRETIAEGYTVHVSIDGKSMVPVPFPDDYRRLFSDFEGRDLEQEWETGAETKE